MSPLANDIAAKHYQALASLSPEQREALDREAICRNAVQLNGRTVDHYREQMFERIARDGR
jgi:hypothetical protein